MIVRDCTILLKNESASLSDMLVLYKGDRNIEYTFELKDNAYKFSNAGVGNIVTQVEASYSQILIYKNPSIRITFPIQPTNNGKVILKIEKELIDESHEVGDYDLQIRLYDSNKEAILTLPPLVKAIRVKSPLFESTGVDSALADTTAIEEAGPEEVPFGEDGNYVKTTWSPGMIISSGKLNKIEGALYKNTSDIKEIAQQKYDDITLAGNELSMKANGIIKKTVTLPNAGETVESHTHINKTALDKITDEKITSWDSKAEGDHNHDTVYAKKTEIPVVDVTKEYVDTKLALKSDVHEHPYLSDKTVIPSKTSQLTNDSNFITAIPDEYITESELSAKGYITNEAIKNKVDKEVDKGLSTNDYTTAEKQKLAGLNNYTLPTASATVLGGVKVGAGLSITAGVLSVNGGGTADSVEWGNVQNKPSTFPPATHNHSYNDLTNKPIIPIVTNDLTTTLKSNYDSAYTHSTSPHAPSNAQRNADITKAEIEAKLVGNIASHTHDQYLTEHQDISNLALKSEIIKSYNDLTDKPAIPTVDVTKEYVDTKLALKSDVHEHPYKPNSYMPDWDEIQNKPSTFTPATHNHSYNDLTNKPTIPTVTNDLTTTLKSNYDSAYTHSTSLHAPSNAQKNSDITASEIETKLVGNITTHTHEQYLTEHQDISKLALKSEIVKSYNQLTDKPVIPSIDGLAKETYVDEKVAEIVDSAPETLNTLQELSKALGNDPNFATTVANQIGTKAATEYVNTELGKKVNTEGYVATENSYTTVEKTKLQGIQERANNYTHPAKHKPSEIAEDNLHRFITDAERQTWNNKSEFTGDYNKLTNKPTIPTVTNDLTTTLKSNYDNAYTHSTSLHAPANAQRNADITKGEIEAKLIGNITTHTHSQYLTQHQSLIDYAKKTEIPNRMSQLQNDASYAKESSIDTKISARLGDIKIKKLTKQEYDSIGSKDPNCLYIIIKTM